MNKAQIHIETSDVAKDQLFVREILVDAQRKFSLFDNSETSRVPGTIISTVEREHYGFGLGAGIVGKLIIVDFSRHKSPSSIFDDVYEFITAKLFLAFPQRAERADESEFIPTH
jgi:hypothetical protein